MSGGGEPAYGCLLHMCAVGVVGAAPVGSQSAVGGAWTALAIRLLSKCYRFVGISARCARDCGRQVRAVAAFLMNMPARRKTSTLSHPGTMSWRMHDARRDRDRYGGAGWTGGGRERGRGDGVVNGVRAACLMTLCCMSLKQRVRCVSQWDVAACSFAVQGGQTKSFMVVHKSFFNSACARGKAELYSAVFQSSTGQTLTET